MGSPVTISLNFLAVCGAFDPRARGLDVCGAVPYLGRAGSVTIHYVRAAHGSATVGFLDRFALVKPVDPDDPGVADVIGDWKKTPGTVGIRIILTKEANRSSDDPGLDSHGAWRIAGKRYAFMTAAERLRVANLAVAGLKVR